MLVRFSESLPESEMLVYGAPAVLKRIDQGRAHFTIIDNQGILTLKELIELGGIRSAHVGQWHSPITVTPAACGMTIIQHEFLGHAGHPEFTVTTFGNTTISEDRGIWAGYAEWSNRKIETENVEIARLAHVAHGPFSFHVAATKHIFPNCELASAAMLRRGGDIIEPLIEVKNGLITIPPGTGNCYTVSEPKLKQYELRKQSFL